MLGPFKLKNQQTTKSMCTGLVSVICKGVLIGMVVLGTMIVLVA